MKRFFKISSYVLIAIIFSIALSGCTKTKKEDPKAKEIVVWSFEDEDIWKPVAKAFATKYKGYKLTYKKQVFDSNYENRVLNSILSNQGPDVWNMPSDWVYRHKDKLASITKKGINIDKYVQSIGQSVTFDDKVYALSPYAEPLMVYYNPKIFDNALHEYNDANTGAENIENRKEATRLLNNVPRTWTDFIKAVNLITKKTSDDKIELSGVAMGTDKIANSTDILYLLMLENGTTILSDNLKQANFNLPINTAQDTPDTPGLRALEFYTSFADPSSENYSWDDSLGSDVDAFAEGKVAMIFGYSSLQNYFAQKYPNFRYKRAFVPQLTAESSKVVDYAKSNVFGVTALTANYKDKPKACWNLLSMLSSESPADGFNSALKVHSSIKSSGEVNFDDRTTNNPEKVSLATAKSLVKGRYPVEFDKIIRASIAAVNQGTQDLQTSLDAAARDITDMLRKESW